MKKYILTVLLTALSLIPARAQGVPPPVIQGSVVQQTPRNPDLPRFDLDFPGGSPKELVETIRESLKGPLNVVLPTNENEVKIPPLKMQQVTVSELFSALGKVSQRSVAYQVGLTDYPTAGFSPGNANRRTTLNTSNESYVFLTDPPVTQNSVWYLMLSTRPQVPENKICRYYQLAPYLKNLKVEDITTAIQAGWKMLGVNNPPELNFHKDTNLLIAVGDQQKLEIIDTVLAELAKAPSTAEPGAPSGKPILPKYPQ